MPLAVPPTQSKRKKRLRPKRVVTTTADKCKKDVLLKRLSTTCPCAQKTCLKQFLEKEKFAEYLQYMREWYDLAKVDQDQIATCRLPYNIFFFFAVARVEWSTCTYNFNIPISDFNQAFDRIRVLLTKAGDQFQTSWELLSLPTCRRAWQSLHTMGYLLGIQNKFYVGKM